MNVILMKDTIVLKKNGILNTILMKDAIVLKNELNTVLSHHSNLQIKQTSHHTFILAERRMLVFWEQIAWIDMQVDYETIRISKHYWHKYEDVIRNLVERIEKHFHQDPPDIDIEVYYSRQEST